VVASERSNLKGSHSIMTYYENVVKISCPKKLEDVFIINIFILVFTAAA